MDHDMLVNERPGGDIQYYKSSKNLQIQPFSGLQDALDWLCEYEQKAASVGWNDTDKYVRFQGYLSGMARSWFNGIVMRVLLDVRLIGNSLQRSSRKLTFQMISHVICINESST